MAPRLPKRRGDAVPPDPPDDAPKADLKQAIAALPAQPGVYLFRDRNGQLLYVGKAKRLDARVRSHFQDPEALGPRQVVLTRRTQAIEYIAVDSEIDALLLEATLVRERQPPFNIRLKDDKRYPYLRVSWQEPFPRLTVVRKVEKDGARYFGPYTEVKSLRALLRLTQTVFPMRTCTDIDAHIQARRECLEFHIGRCTGPCIAAQSAEDYRAMVDQFCDFLSGRREEVVTRLRALQENAAERREYERAARLRDQIKKLEQIFARQRMVDVAGLSADVLGLAREGERCCVVVLKVRERRVVAKDVRWLRGTRGKTEGELLRAFVTLYYTQTEAIPETLVVETDPAECELLVSYLERNAGSPVRVRQPRDATERALLRTGHRNATMLVSQAREAAGKGIEGNAADEAIELQRALGIDRLPRRIRCFDVSQLFGTYVVASMVTFIDGRPFKNEYRHYRIRTVEGQDDFASIAEAVRRHAGRVTEGDMEAADLVLIDGGIGQLQAALAAVQGTPLESVPFAGLAKRLEEIVRPGGAPVLRLSRRSPALKLLMRVRDEAHRFAITYHRTLRGRALRSTELEKVPGLGPKRQALLLRRFGSVERLKQQPVDAIAAVPGIGERMAARILEVVGSAGGQS